jgi:hypothetical protein
LIVAVIRRCAVYETKCRVVVFDVEKLREMEEKKNERTKTKKNNR